MLSVLHEKESLCTFSLPYYQKYKSKFGLVNLCVGPSSLHINESTASFMQKQEKYYSYLLKMYISFSGFY